MVTKVVKTGPEEVEDTLKAAMKVVQRKLEDGKLKVKLLNGLVELKEILDNEVKELNGRRD